MEYKKTVLESDQWVPAGNCSKCRRRPYCSKECSARKRRREMLLKSAVTNVLQRRGVSSEMIANTDD